MQKSNNSTSKNKGTNLVSEFLEKLSEVIPIFREILVIHSLRNQDRISSQYRKQYTLTFAFFFIIVLL
jgi:hypothetical protein